MSKPGASLLISRGHQIETDVSQVSKFRMLVYCQT